MYFLFCNRSNLFLFILFIGNSIIYYFKISYNKIQYVEMSWEGLDNIFKTCMKINYKIILHFKIFQEQFP